MRDNGVHKMELSEAEATLRLIAKLPAPEGLVKRVQGGLSAASKDARMLQWPAADASHGWWNGWMRGAAAAALVCVVAGGAWQILMRTVPASGGSAATAPVRVRPAGGFSSAGAMRIPQTLNGPVLVKKPNAADAGAKKKDDAKKPVEAGPR